MKAIFLHHAGGDKYSWRRYQDALPKGIEAISLEIPGRGDRFSEPLLNNMEEITSDLFQQALAHIQQPYVLVGKSMGALMGYLLLHRMAQAGLPLPLHVFFGSRKCPASYSGHIRIAHQESNHFWKGVESYGGLPQMLLEHQELKELYEPILRADFSALEQYEHVSRPPLPLSATIMTGKTDSISLESTHGWSDHFSGEVDFLDLPGGHFFMHEQAYTISAMIAERLSEQPANS
jgi:surfactin synthase thioesterase subunit